MEYANHQIGTFIERPNRFIAHCQLDGEVVVVHVKNTGRGKELLVPGAPVSLVHNDNPKRKTAYDLVAVKKGVHWINIDSQAPNPVLHEAVDHQAVHFPGIQQVTKFLPEVQFLDSRLDFQGFDQHGQPFFVEVKGVTLENNGLAAFPDAPTTRGLKHVHTLMQAVALGYPAYLFFVVQLDYVQQMTIYAERAPKLAQAIQQAQQAGVQVLAAGCTVTPQTIQLAKPIDFQLGLPFKEL